MHTELDSGVDADLFEAIRLDNLNWRDIIFRRYEKMVRNLIIRRLPSSADVDDLVSEVFLRFFEGACRVRSAAGLRNYLYSIALYTVRGDMRFRLRERGVLSRLSPCLADETVSSDDPEARAALRQLEAILLGMRPSNREAYVLRRIVGLNVSQIASALGVSRSTVQRRVRLARRSVEMRAAQSVLLSDYLRFGRSPVRHALGDRTLGREHCGD